MSSAIPFMTLTPGEDANEVREAIDRVITRGWFILGPEVEAFEAEFASACGARHAIGMGTGTDAIALILRALGIGAGDEVITAPLSAAFSAIAIQMAGATPVFADIDPVRLTLDPAAAAAAITPRTKAILPVHLYGQPADMQALRELAAKRGLAIIEDACQAHLATCDGRPVGSYGIAAAYSFYPTKNLGALGDGGAVTTDDDALARRVREIADHGRPADPSKRDEHLIPGLNSRLDALQASLLRVKLEHVADWNALRAAVALRYV